MPYGQVRYFTIHAHTRHIPLACLYMPIKLCPLACNIVIGSGGSRIGGNARRLWWRSRWKCFRRFCVILQASAACVQSTMGFTRLTPHSRTTITTTTVATAIIAAAANYLLLLRLLLLSCYHKTDWPAPNRTRFETFRKDTSVVVIKQPNRSHTCSADVLLLYVYSRTPSPLLRSV